MPHTVQVAVNNATLHFDKLYTYRVPPELESKVPVGGMVLVPFGRGDKPRMAVVLAAGESEELSARVKPLYDAAPESACLTPDLLRLVEFLHERTFCTWYEAVKTVIPYGAQYRPVLQDGRPVLQKQLVRHTQPQYRLAAPLPEKPRPTPPQILAVQLLRDGPLTGEELQQAGVSAAVADNLVKKGVLEKEQVDKTLDLYAHIPLTNETITLTDEQQAALDALLPALRAGKPHAALLHGVTGSGKTLVFLELIRHTLELGRTALVLVPEISLTPQMIRRLKENFGSRVAVQHSALNHTERLLQWRMIQQGGAQIVVGTRSAIFAPLQNLGLIIIDEEQEHTYRSESSPRFDAHDVARLRAADSGALLLLASATPSVESYYRAARQDRYQLVRLTHRYAGQPLPPVQIVDMRAEAAAGNPEDISQPLADAIRENLTNGQQTILLLNRRGYRTVALCQDCGAALKCSSCSVPMVYHKAQGQMLCHYCGKTIKPAPTHCPQCGGKLLYTGFGTQRVEEELENLFPKARVLRMDQDSTSRKNAHEQLLARFAKGEYDILLGTQMVAKGLDFEKVTLVGVLGIDSLLFSQGYRAYENVFSLITQVVGRGGRAEYPGRAIIQTVSPGHPVLQLAAKQDYEAFFEEEIGFRQLCLYPPFCDLCMVGFSGEKEGPALAAAARFSAILAETARQNWPKLPMRVLGPAPMNVAMVKDLYRFKLAIKCRNTNDFRALMRAVLARYGEEGLPAKAAVTLDFNADGDM